MKEVLKKIAIRKWGSLKNALWKEKGNEVNFRCPICGDSKKAPLRKARFWFNLERGVGHCFNCGWSGNLKKLLNDVGMNFSYVMKASDVFKKVEADDSVENPFSNLLIVPLNVKNFNGLEREYSSLYLKAELRRLMEARRYILSRKISYTPFFLFFKAAEGDIETEKAYAKFVHYVFIPLKDVNGSIVGVQGRAFLKGAKARYFTKHLANGKVLAYGLHKLPKNEKEYIWLVEGVFDALSLEEIDKGSVAVASLSISKFSLNSPFMEYLIEQSKRKTIRLVVDNDNNRDMLIRQFLHRPGFEVWLVPEQFKDVNEFLVAGGNKGGLEKLTLKKYISLRG